MNKTALKNKTKRLGLVITDGVGYRNFVLSSFLTEAAKEFTEIIIFSGLPGSAFEHVNSSIAVVELPVFKEQKHHWFFRKLKEVAHLQKHRKNPGIADNLCMNRKTGLSPNAILTQIIYGITSIFHSEKAILKYEKWQEQLFSNHQIVQSYGKLLQEYRPDTLFFTHQRPPFIATLVYQARKLNIPTSAFIFSWDNLASKGRMATTFDQYLVWSALMKSELLRFYPQTNEKQVEIVGTPQFEPYADLRNLITKADFLVHYGLKPDQKIICYSCADGSIGPNDPLVISVIAKAIRDKKIENCQLLVRTSPAEDEVRFANVKSDFPEIAWNHPHWKQTRIDHPEPWSQRIPLSEDLEELKAVLAHTDVNVNMCSTMSLDFMLFGKPVINTVFGNKKNGLYDDQRFLLYEHYQHVIESGAVKIAKNADELIVGLQEYLKNPLQDHEKQQRLLTVEVGIPLEETTKKCINALQG